jgi:hypothetical protein
VLAGGEGQPGVLEVQRVGGGDVDDVDGGVGDQLVVRAVRRRGAVPVREGPGALGTPGADGGEPGAGRERQVGGEAVGDLAGGEDAPADGVLHGSSAPAPRRAPPRA